MNRIFSPLVETSSWLSASPRATFLRVVSCVVLIVSAVAPLSLRAQQSSSPEGRKARAAAHGKIVSDAKALALQGDLDGAETALASLSSARAQTDQWHFERALHLTQLATNLARGGDLASAHLAASRALRALEDADRLATDPLLRAGIYQQTGYLQDRFMGDKAAAQTAYRASAQTSPDSKSAKERLQRFEAAEADSQLKASNR